MALKRADWKSSQPAIDPERLVFLDETGLKANLQTIPGVGRKTAEVLVTALDDVHRFAKARQVSAYIGLVPRQYQSGETDRHGRITKRGSILLRSILLECAWVSLQYNPWTHATYDRIHGGQKTRKKEAAIAVARKIAVVTWSMLKHETDWDPQRLGIEVEQEPEHTAAGSRLRTDAAVIA